MKTKRSGRGPNLATIQRIKDLAEYRELHRDRSGRPPTWTSACQALRINYRTIRRHAPELPQKWYDVNFHW